MKRVIAIILVLTMTVTLSFTGCGNSSDSAPADETATIEVQDDAGRTVEVPGEITRVAPAT